MKKVIDYVYIISSILGAVVIASNTGTQFVGYCLFLLSSLCTLYLLHLSDASKSLWIVNGMFAVINLYGVIRS